MKKIFFVMFLISFTCFVLVATASWFGVGRSPSQTARVAQQKSGAQKIGPFQAYPVPPPPSVSPSSPSVPRNRNVIDVAFVWTAVSSAVTLMATILTQIFAWRKDRREDFLIRRGR